jgi:hypothetical protein
VPHDALVILGAFSHGLIRDMMFGSKMEKIQTSITNNLLIVGSRYSALPDKVCQPKKLLTIHQGALGDVVTSFTSLLLLRRHIPKSILYAGSPLATWLSTLR